MSTPPFDAPLVLDQLGTPFPVSGQISLTASFTIRGTTPNTQDATSITCTLTKLQLYATRAAWLYFACTRTAIWPHARTVTRGTRRAEASDQGGRMLRTLVIALLAVVPVAGLAPGCAGDNLSTKGQLVSCDPQSGTCTPTDNPTPAPGMCTDIDEDGDGEAHDATEAEDGHDSVSDTDDDNDGTPDTADTDDDNDGIPDTADCDELPGGDGADS